MDISENEGGMSMDEAAALLGLMDALLPGGDGFPAASTTGIAATVAARLRQVDADLLHRVVAFASERTSREWHEIAAQLEAVEPDLFDKFRKYAYLTYYEQKQVIAVIRNLGFHYNDTPLPDGYADEPFEMSRDAPHHGRGRWTPTAEVQRVNLDGLGLEENR